MQLEASMLITLAQAAERLGLSTSTLREQVHRGRLAAQKIGRDWLVEETEVDRYRLESKGQAGRPPKTFPTIPGIRGARTKGR
jgi:excisionase family DNA binding protein